jgi:tight adherence protein B
MLLTLLSIFLAVFALAVLLIALTGKGGSPQASARLAALDRQFTPSEGDDGPPDIRRAQRKLSAIPWLNHFLAEKDLAAAATLYLYQAGVTTTLGALFMTSLATSAATGFVLYLRFGATLAVALASLAALGLPFLYVRYKRAKRFSKMEEQLPEALGMMVSSLRVGHGLVASLGSIGQECAAPIGPEMRKCFDEQNYGVDLRTAFSHLLERAPIQDFRIFVAAVLIQKETGGNLAEVLENVADTTRERYRLKKQVSVHTAQGRMTGWILSILPVALGFGMYLMNPSGMSVLWKTPVGLKLLYTSAGMEFVGALIIRKIVGIRV